MIYLNWETREMRFNLAVVALALTIISVTGCQTVRGAGGDLQELGKTIQGQ